MKLWPFPFGEADPATYRVHVPAEVDVRKIRTALKLSQAQFAARFGLPAANDQGTGQEMPSMVSQLR